MRRTLTTFLVLTLAATAAAQDAAPAKLDDATRAFDQRHLDLSLVLELTKGTVLGTATHRMAPLRDGVTQVQLHLEDMQVEWVKTGEGTECAHTHEKDVLTITLDRARVKDQEFELVIRYGGKPTAGLWFFRPTEEHPEIPLQVWSQGQGTENRHWMPVYDLPDDRLTTRLEVDLPAGLTTLSNGKPLFKRESQPGREVHAWETGREHPPYLVTLVAGTFEDVRKDVAGVEHHMLVPPGWGDATDEIFGRTESMMAFFADYTGQPYPYSRYSQVTVWDFMWGGMENTMATTLNMRALHRDGVRPDYTADGLIAHELAHMWFGDLITCRTWNHIWLNEGFATYFTDLWVEHHHGKEDYASGRLRQRDSYLDGAKLPAEASKQSDREPTECGDVQGHAYVKGSSILHMLRGVLGDDVFRDGVRGYVAAARDRSVDSEVLRTSLEKVSGRDLAGFFDRWVYGSGHPVLDVRGKWDAAAGAFVLRVSQTQPATPQMPHFAFPLDVEVTWPDGTTERRRHDVSSASHAWRIQGEGKPLRWRVDADGWLLARINATKSGAEWEAQLTDDPRNTGRVLAARALGGMGQKTVEALAKSAAGDARYDVRGAACEALGKLGGRRAADALKAAAEDADSRVRTAALKALGGFPSNWSFVTLAKHADADPSHYASAEAAAALGKIREPKLYDFLIDLLDRESHRDVIRRETMNALGSFGDPRGAAVAREYTAYKWGKGLQHRLRHAALDAMVKLDPRGEESRARVLELITDPYFRMRTWAAAHAANLGIEEAVPVLEEALKTHGTGPGVKGAYERALAKLRE